MLPEKLPGKKGKGLIAFGGGSVLDVAKTTAVLITSEGGIEDYLGVDLVTNPPAFMVAIPATSEREAKSLRASVILFRKKTVNPVFRVL